jgi:hypothetical protein
MNIPKYQLVVKRASDLINDVLENEAIKYPLIQGRGERNIAALKT